MRLERLELSGFKSFAKTTVLEFPSAVTGVVGPNGSGKTNIKDAIQWVLGEQSMKSLRGKKGEDLIWNGSASSPRSGAPTHPRMGKASASLTFDNTDHAIPVDFDKVALARRIFRDGSNEYEINNSPVRMRDVHMLVARIGLGETKHNIIGQGEVDRMLTASLRERREMLAEALGLRVFQLKKNEAERKLATTEENIKQVDALIREIVPHLRFLKLQAQKAEQREEVGAQLKKLEYAYLAREYSNLAWEREQLLARQEPLIQTQHALDEEINALQFSLDETQAAPVSALGGQEEAALAALEHKRRELERELGRLEGRRESEAENTRRPQTRAVDMHYIKEEVSAFLVEVKTVLEQEDHIDIVRSHLLALVDDLERLLEQMDTGLLKKQDQGPESRPLQELEKTITAMKEEMRVIDDQIAAQKHTRAQALGAFQSLQLQMREVNNRLRNAEHEARDNAIARDRISFAWEQLRMREERFRADCADAGVAPEELAKHTATDQAKELPPGEDLRRKIDRMRLRLEEIGGIDPAVIKEYEETQARHAFLERELGDVKQAARDLRELIKDLDRQMRHSFKEGFLKINEAFHKYFRIIFEGGKAALKMTNEQLSVVNDEEGDEESEKIEEGIEIEVDLPRKRIRGLAMLSGGERALTSIALLFAISAVNPPPFLILDETDAALDEANSQRYGAILKELARQTQLILITHNRETMKSAGILYGVTMGEDGVSRLISLKFEEAETYTNR